MSPMVWDLAHIGNYEELWLLRALDHRPPIDASLDDLYNAFEHPRWERPSLPILGPAEARAYLREVRGQVLDLLERVDRLPLDEPAARLVVDGFVYGMVIQHEHQHDETLLATHQLRGVQAITLACPRSSLSDADPWSTSRSRPTWPGPTAKPMSAPAAADERTDGVHDRRRTLFTLGTSTEPWAYDNERQAHVVDLAPYRIDRRGGRRNRITTWPSSPTAATTTSACGRRPGGPPARTSTWSTRSSGRGRRRGRGACCASAASSTWPTTSTSRCSTWAGTRPTPSLSVGPASACPPKPSGRRAAVRRPGRPRGHASRWPWGDDAPSPVRANLGQRRDEDPARRAATPAGASPSGCLAMIGDVWEWTASDFRPYPGFEAWPYPEYSEVFWGDEYKVLRGGSWATDPSAVRATFRNWDLPIRRQIFAGFRCARDA